MSYHEAGRMYVLIGYGLYRLASGGMVYEPPPSAKVPSAETLGVFLLLRAFAQGCTAMTGTEAISNGVPAFKPPESANARTTLVAMGVLLGTMFLGLSYLAIQIGILPADQETVISQIGRTVFGIGPIWWVLQIATAMIERFLTGLFGASNERLMRRLGFLRKGDQTTITPGSLLDKINQQEALRVGSNFSMV